MFAAKIAPDGAVLYARSIASNNNSDALIPADVGVDNAGHIRFAGLLQGAVAFDGTTVLNTGAGISQGFTLGWTP
jgi:hypothetical protein